MASRNGADTDEFTLGNAGDDNNLGGGNSENKSGNGDGVGNATGAIDPVSARDGNGYTEYTGGTNKDGSPSRKRGRKPGQGNKQSSAKTQAHDTQDIGAIQALLISFHGALAVKIPEMELSEEEAKRLAENIARVEQYYPKIRAVLSGRVAAHGALAMTLIGIYGPRFAAIKIRVAAENAKDVTPQTSNVHPFTAPHGNT